MCLLARRSWSHWFHTNKKKVVIIWTIGSKLSYLKIHMRHHGSRFMMAHVDPNDVTHNYFKMSHTSLHWNPSLIKSAVIIPH